MPETPSFQNRSKYLLNCFILALPVLAWNLAFTDKLPALFQPAIFREDIPTWVQLAEDISRSLLFLIMLLFPLQITTTIQKQGLMIYITGVALYFTSWLLLIYFPNSSWSCSLTGFLAPAYTPMIWLAGIGMIGGKPFIHLPFLRQSYLVIVIVFTIFHCGHTYLIFSRNIIHQTGQSSIPLR